MSASLRFRMGVVAAGLSCLFMGYAAAQEQQTLEPGQRVVPGQQDPSRPNAGQIDRPITQLRERASEALAGRQNEEVERYLANCMLIRNQACTDIDQFAAQRAQNPAVKQFAEQMVQEHRQIVQKLEQLAGAGRQYDAQQAGGTTRLPGSTQPATATDSTSPATSQALAGTDRPIWGALNQLLTIDRQIAERCTQAVKEELQAKSGAEFDQCYLGAEIGGHTQMLAALEVIEQQTQGPLKQIAQQARPTVAQHLAQAKQLMKEATSASQTARQPDGREVRTQ